MARRSQSAVRNVSLVALPESSGSVLYGLYDVLSSVGIAWPAVTGEDLGTTPFNVKIIAKTMRPFRCWGGIPVSPQQSFPKVDATDIVIVTNLEITPDYDPRGRWPRARSIDVKELPSRFWSDHEGTDSIEEAGYVIDGN